MAPCPSVSIAIPTLNESAHIENVVSCFLATRYPNLIDVIVVDGGSSDGTQEIVKALGERDPRVKLVCNPERIQAAGLNLALREASGEVFLRADAHCEYASDYVERCVETLVQTGAVNVGGAQRFVARTAFQAGVALASSSLLGSGRARYRDPGFDGYADTVYLGCMWRSALLEVSGYSLKATNEDAELNLRLQQHFGSSAGEGMSSGLYTSSRIKVWYYPRQSWWGLCRQYFRYGRGRCETVRAHPGRSSLRGRLPFLFLSTVTLLLLLDLLFFGGGLHTAGALVVGLLVPFVEGFRVSLGSLERFATEYWRAERSAMPSVLTRALSCGLALLTQPICHFAGFAYQLLAGAIGNPSLQEAMK